MGDDTEPSVASPLATLRQIDPGSRDDEQARDASNGGPLSSGVVVDADGIGRCRWAASDPLLRAYHDTEWGVPIHGERALFERISLEAFQSGLSWRTILAKRPAFRRAFLQFDPELVAALSDVDVERLLRDPTIVRNRRKIEATIANARATLALRPIGGLDALIWSFSPREPTRRSEAMSSSIATNAELISSHPEPVTRSSEPVTRSPESTALASTLRARGFRFVGPTTTYALMEAAGMVDGHLPGCHRHGRTAMGGATG